MPATSISAYLTQLRQDLRAGGATERTHYSALRALIEALRPGVTAPFEQKRIDCGAPDFHVRQSETIIGHIEAKDVGHSLDESERAEQMAKRYLPALPNLILTNYLEFRWYRNGQSVLTATLGHLDSHGAIRSASQAQAEVIGLMGDFLSVAPRGADNAKDLAVRLARLAHEIRITIEQAFRQGQVSATIDDLRQAVQKQLIPDLANDQFADMFAQTLVYGFFAARCNHTAGRFQRYGAAADIPKTNPFLRQLFQAITGVELDDEPFVCYVDDLIQLLGLTDMAGVLADFGQRTGRADPVVHFYETFLKAYDPKLRELRGVYYTPEPVVSYMVRSVDHLLRTRFNCPGGLADTTPVTYQREADDGRKETVTSPRVLVLDPALGTGTFLYAIVDLIRERFRRENNAGMWSSFVRQHLLPRLFGFEFLMAPYAVAHLKLGMQLAGQDLTDAERETWAYDFSGDERLGVYLTNTLDEAAHKAETLFGPYRAITEEANAAAEIKRDMPIMVVIGNPPYSGHSANKGTWIEALIEDYRKGYPELRKPGQAKWLHDDYVKFIRFAQWRIGQSGAGVVALVTNHSYLDSPTFKGMRCELLRSFDQVYVLDLHGNTRRKEVCPDGSPDRNVFDIKQGVAILFLVRLPRSGASESMTTQAEVRHSELWGLRGDDGRNPGKYQWLSAHDVSSTTWVTLDPLGPDFLFVPQDTALAVEYQSAFPVPVVMGLNGDPAPGIVTTHDDFAISWSPDEASNKVDRLLSTQSEDDARSIFRLCSQAQWSYTRAKTELADRHWEHEIRPILYRPFDLRYTVFNRNVAVHRRGRVMRHLTAGANVALITSRLTKGEQFHHAQATRDLVEVICMSPNTSNNGFVFPLYLYPEPGRDAIVRDDQINERVDAVGRAGGDYSSLPSLMHRLFPEPEYPRWPNLDPFLLADLRDRLALRFIPDGQGDLTETFGPEDVFDYIYAILHSATYRSRYAEFLKRDFPRIPFTSNRNLFTNLVLKGRDLIALHLMESPLLDALITTFPESGSDKVERVAYNDNQRRVYINKTQYFDGVPKAVWEFHVGGYQVCDKWLKDRKGRKLDNDNLMHYQRIVVALNETIRLMAEIDALITCWPVA